MVDPRPELDTFVNLFRILTSDDDLAGVAIQLEHGAGGDLALLVDTDHVRGPEQLRKLAELAEKNKRSLRIWQGWLIFE